MRAADPAADAGTIGGCGCDIDVGNGCESGGGNGCDVDVDNGCESGGGNGCESDAGVWDIGSGSDDFTARCEGGSDAFPARDAWFPAPCTADEDDSDAFPERWGDGVTAPCADDGASDACPERWGDGVTAPCADGGASDACPERDDIDGLTAPCPTDEGDAFTERGGGDAFTERGGGDAFPERGGDEDTVADRVDGGSVPGPPRAPSARASSIVTLAPIASRSRAYSSAVA